MTETNNPLGFPVPDWTPPRRPDATMLEGAYALLERLDADRHAEPLYEAFAGHEALWDYMPQGPFDSAAAYRDWAQEAERDQDMIFYAIGNKESGAWEGVASYLRIAPAAGSIEVGNICFSPALQRTRAATDAMYLMMRWAFEAGYRRYEWKCNALNAPSRRAAQRFGLSYEGVFRQALVVKGRNRDTAWFAAIDKEWPTLRTAFETWLLPDNFDANGQQNQSLATLTAPVLGARDPSI